MNHIPLRTRRLALYPLSAFLLAVCFYFPGLAYANNQISGEISTTPTEGVAAEPSGCDLRFSSSHEYDYGVQSSIALNSTGIALEFHRSEFGSKISYRVGKQSQQNKNYIDWGNSQSADANGYRPAVALSKEGYVIDVHSDRSSKRGSKQYYRVGKIDPNGDENGDGMAADNLATAVSTGPSLSDWVGQRQARQETLGRSSSTAFSDWFMAFIHRANHPW
jgi:hypothetical protein